MVEKIFWNLPRLNLFIFLSYYLNMNVPSPLSSAEGQIHNQFIFDCFTISQCLHILQMGKILFIFKIHTSFV